MTTPTPARRADQPVCPDCKDSGIRREGTNGFACYPCTCPAGQRIRSFSDLDIACREEGT